MGQALYRKYRSKSLDELVGQEHVTSTLRNALKQGRVSHAYLLSGPRGVGKTSIARILAHEINGLPYDDEAHLDIIEIDAASNRRIDEIRDLRDRVNTAPASAKYKVYIIDEVHMLAKEAFNALLKTLEEPPAHVIFILATTEAHKLPETIVSRTQRYSLRPVPAQQVISHLKTIAKGEHIDVDDDALKLIAEHGEGSFRDSISMLDQASSIDKHVSRKHVEDMLGLASAENIKRLQAAVTGASAADIVTVLNELYGQGYEPAMIASQLGAAIRNAVLSSQVTDPTDSLHLLKHLLDVPASRSPRQLLELVLLQSALGSKPAGHAIASEPAQTNKNDRPATEVPETKTTPTITPPVVSAPDPKPVKPANKSTPDSAATPTTHSTPASVAPSELSPPTKDADELWQQTLNEIKKQYNTLYGIARMAKPELSGTTLILSFKFAFHQKRINEARNRKIFADVVERLYGEPVEIVCVVIDPADDAAAPDVTTISNIFGGAELLQ